MNGRDRIMNSLNLEPVDRTPVWFMRQAGRHLPEYRENCRKAFILGTMHGYRIMY